MYKLTTALLLSVSISTSVVASNETSEVNKQENQSVLSSIFDIQPFSCDTFPDCDIGISEAELMMRAKEREKEVYTTSGEDNSDKADTATIVK